MFYGNVLAQLGADGEGLARARKQIAPYAFPAPLLAAPWVGDRELRLKAECLQPLGSFKIRAAANALSRYSPEELKAGVACPSAGNFGQGLAHVAARLGIPLTVHVPDNAAATKVASLRRLGARVEVHPFLRWWDIMSTRQTGEEGKIFIHPVCEPEVVLGNGTIGAEIIEEWNDVDVIVVPVGGGGLACGIALALCAAGHHARVVACEVSTAAPLHAALQAGHPVTIERAPSFVDGIGSTRVLDEMWPALRELVDSVVVVTPEEAALAVRDAAQEANLVVEGAGGAALAAARSEAFAGLRVAAILSGGNIDSQVLSEILAQDS